MQIREKVSAMADKAAMGALLVGATLASAQAALPTEVEAAFTAVETDGTAMIAKGWPVVTAIVGGLILIKLFKKVANRSS